MFFFLFYFLIKKSSARKRGIERKKESGFWDLESYVGLLLLHVPLLKENNETRMRKYSKIFVFVPVLVAQNAFFVFAQTTATPTSTTRHKCVFDGYYHNPNAFTTVPCPNAVPCEPGNYCRYDFWFISKQALSVSF